MHQGYIKLYRCFKRSAFYKDSEYVHLWVHLLMSVNRTQVRLKLPKSDRFIDLMPGQVLTGRSMLVEQTGINRSKIERILKAFESEQQIEQQTFSKYRVISISNWEQYQCSEHENEQQMSSKRAADEQQMSTNKNVKEVKEEKKESIGAKRFCPPTLEAVSEYCQERNNGVNPSKWHSHYTSKGWMIGKNKMKDWKAAVRTWEEDKPQVASAGPVTTAADIERLHRAQAKYA